MNKKTLFSFVLGSLLCAVVLCTLLSSFMLSIDQRNSDVLAQAMWRFYAHVLESAPIPEGMQRLVAYRKNIPFFTSSLWMVDDHNRILAANNTAPLPEKWLKMGRSAAVYESTAWGSVNAIRLNRTQPSFLVIQTNDQPIVFRNTRVKIVGGFILFAGAALMAFFALFLYLRGKSAEAKRILHRLEKGDLKARFQIQSLDEIGSLMLDFNRMAEEIERLVCRLHQTENTRRSLIQELGHDIRTPLMTLRTSLEGLATDWNVMSPADRDRVLHNCQSEVKYFGDLVEGLFFVAQMDELRYKESPESIDLVDLVRSQLRPIESANPQIKWKLRSPKTAPLVGDLSLLQRMIRNLLENAARFAAAEVCVTLEEEGNGYRLQIADDGPGMSQAQISHYGKRRLQPYLREFRDGKVSLGLGSVIVSRVIELHQGSISIRSDKSVKPFATTIDVFVPSFQSPEKRTAMQ